MKLSIIIPAHNEEQRIGPTLNAYCSYFKKLETEEKLTFELIVVLNGCTDNTLAVVEKIVNVYGHIYIIDLKQAGKGLAIMTGFKDSLKRENDLIGFVDADMATGPRYFYDLVKNIGDYDGIIASRYMKGARIFPPRPWYKRWGSRIVYENIVYIFFGLWYFDYQCGAKLFKRHVIEKVVTQLTVYQWAFDVELLYLCKKDDFKIKEYPTVWYDKEGSKLSLLTSGLHMLGSVIRLRLYHSPFGRFIKKE